MGYDSPDIIDQMYLTKLRENKLETKDKSKIFRYAIPLKVDGGVPENQNLVRGMMKQLFLPSAGRLKNLRENFFFLKFEFSY